MKLTHLLLAIATLAGAIFIAASAPANAQFQVASSDQVPVLR